MIGTVGKFTSRLTRLTAMGVLLWVAWSSFAGSLFASPECTLKVTGLPGAKERTTVIRPKWRVYMYSDVPHIYVGTTTITGKSGREVSACRLDVRALAKNPNHADWRMGFNLAPGIVSAPTPKMRLTADMRADAPITFDTAYGYVASGGWAGPAFPLKKLDRKWRTVYIDIPKLDKPTLEFWLRLVVSDARISTTTAFYLADLRLDIIE